MVILFTAAMNLLVKTVEKPRSKLPSLIQEELCIEGNT